MCAHLGPQVDFHVLGSAQPRSSLINRDGQNYNLHPLLLAFHCQHDQRRWASRFGPVSRAEGAGFSHFHVYVSAPGQLLLQKSPTIPTNSPSEI